MPKLGAYSNEIRLANPDRRTKEARLLKQMRVELAKHLGGEDKLSATQRILVERAAMLQLRCALLDRKIVEGGKFTHVDNRTYLAWTNSLTRTITALGLQPAPKAGPSFEELVRQTYDEAAE